MTTTNTSETMLQPTMYEKASSETEKDINIEAREITDKLKISDRVEPIAHNKAYITIKDHKDEFPNVVKCRLINPAKTQIGRLSKEILQEVNSKIRETYNLNQWRSTGETLQWFKEIKEKTRRVFLQLDIVDFYPSINEELLNEALDFADSVTPLSQINRQILKNARKSLLFSNDTTWQKKTGLHDVTMGSYDGCEVCELVGLLLLKEMAQHFPEIDFGLYRDDGLGVHRRLPGPRVEQMKKEIHELFKRHGLKITLETKMTIVNFLDVTLDLHKDSYAPYRKPNDHPLYINVQSNHPKSVISQVPRSVEKRLNHISSTKDIFMKAKTDYEKALKSSGFKDKIIYNQNENQGKQSKRKRKRRDVIFFNPPYNRDVKTDIGRQFLRLIDKNFPVNSPLHPILNRYNIKLSYSCTENIEKILSKHNSKILTSEATKPKQKLCNCRDRTKCPVKNKCLTESVIYKASIESAEYIGLTENEFKIRYTQHMSSFRNPLTKRSTTLAAHVREHSLDSSKIKWEIIAQCHPYQAGQSTCNLCLSEKLHILKNINSPKSLNKRSDIGNKCTLHKKKHFLDRIT